jgi:N-sulfoglucosamine sulfohydrolase
VATARDRCDQTIDRIRSIRTDRFRFTRNYMLDRVLLQPQYRDSRDFVQFLRKSYADGSLDPKLADIYFGERPAEELYDMTTDTDCVHNLAEDTQFAKTKSKLWKQLRQELSDQGDPRILGQGDIFDFYPNCRIDRQQKIYDRPDYDPVKIFNKMYGKKSSPPNPE